MNMHDIALEALTQEHKPAPQAVAAGKSEDELADLQRQLSESAADPNQSIVTGLLDPLVVGDGWITLNMDADAPRTDTSPDESLSKLIDPNSKCVGIRVDKEDDELLRAGKLKEVYMRQCDRMLENFKASGHAPPDEGEWKAQMWARMSSRIDSSERVAAFGKIDVQMDGELEVKTECNQVESNEAKVGTVREKALKGLTFAPPPLDLYQGISDGCRHVQPDQPILLQYPGQASTGASAMIDEDDSTRSALGCLGVTLSGPVLLVMIVLLRGYVASILWGWFLVPLGLPVIGIAHAIGVSMTVHMACGASSSSFSENKDLSPGLRLIVMMCGHAFGSLLLLLVGYIIKCFM